MPNEDHEKENWVRFSQVDKIRYVGLIAAASALGTLGSHPFFVLTTRQQAGLHVISKGPNSKISTGIRNSLLSLGWRGMFRGWIPVTLFNIPCSSTDLSVTESSREHLRCSLFANYPKAPIVLIDAVQAACSATMANIVSSAVVNPAEVVASRMIVQCSTKVTTIRSTIHHIYKLYGIKGFWHGYNASVTQGIATSTAWWWSYTQVRRILSAHLDPCKDSVTIDAGSGLFAGIATTVIAHPIDTVRARIMTGTSPTTSTISTLRLVVSQHGVRALYYGLLPSLCESAWTSVVFASVYELIKRTAADAILSSEDVVI